MVEHLAARLGIEDPTAMKRASESKRTALPTTVTLRPEAASTGRRVLAGRRTLPPSRSDVP
ncbi:hypothetical protein [Streptomyces sp. NRRL B-1381]|uniref:hypothetical protein n=1 Tax=Streptomyces sp. NRRL B-1381 TaxID=1463829 RepID=UPI0004C237BD|nr:hypothetical protein [Streptomyces sp. NRRL B-1381]